MEKYYESPAITKAKRRRNISYSIIGSSLFFATLIAYRLTVPSQDIYLNNVNDSSFVYDSKNSQVLINSSLDKSYSKINSSLKNSELEDKLGFKENRTANSQIQPLEYIPIEIPE